MDGSSKPLQFEGVDLAALGRCLIALADGTRQEIVGLLSRERLNVGQLAERLSLSQPAVSHHLKILAGAGVLKQERRGRERLYRLDARYCQSFVGELKRFVNQCCTNARCC